MLKQMVAAALLPREVVLRSKSNDRYLECVMEEGKAKGFLRFGREDFASLHSKFEVDPARTGSHLVHLRSSHNNKYLTAVNETTRWIIPGSDEPEEDQSKWSCTLFRPAPVGADDFRFMHVRTGNYVALTRMGGESAFDNCLLAGLPYPLQDQSDVVTVVDWGSLVVLPRHVAFRGDNGSYLSAQLLGDKHFLQFSVFNGGDPTVAHEVFRNPDGSIRVKSTHFDRFWRVDPSDENNWVLSDSDNNGKNTHFWPVRIDHNTVALRSLGNNLFCKRLSAPGLVNCLGATDHSLACLQVTDLTRSREIYIV